MSTETVSPTRRQPHLLLRGLPLIAVGLLMAPLPGEAQQGRSVEWTETSRLELPGTLGVMIRALPGVSGERETRHAIHQSGRILVTTDGSHSTILDLEERRWTAVDHDDESYVSLSFEESAAAMQEMMAVMQEAQAGAQEALREAEMDREEAMAEMRRAMEEAQAQFTVRINAERTGRTGTVNGLRAEQHFLVTEIESTGVEGVEGADDGTVAFVVELWQSDEFPDAEELYAEWAREMAEDPALQAMAQDMAESLEPLTGEEGWEMLALWNPGVAAGLSQLAEAMESLEGTTIRSVTHVAFVPRGLSLNREELLAWEPESMGDQLRGQAGAAAQEAARDAARSALRGATRGLLGRGGGGDEPEPEEVPVVRPLMRLTQEKADIRVGPVDRSSPVFQVPEGFREIPLMGLPGMEGPDGGR
jgi:hypothetical protein